MSQPNHAVPSPLVERTAAGLHASLMSHLPPLAKDVPILDVGCGTGAWLARLAAEGFTQLHGIDQDVGAFGCAGATCSQANLNLDDVGLGDRRFGLISAIEVLEHLENPGRLFFHVQRHLAPDGCLLLTTPNLHSIAARLRFLMTGRLPEFDHKGDPTHIYPVLLVALERVLPRYGLRLVEKWGYPVAGSVVYRRSLRHVARVLQHVLPEAVAGDTLCMLVKRA